MSNIATLLMLPIFWQMDLGKYLKEKKRLDPERAVSYALDIARYILYSKSYIVSLLSDTFN